MNIGAIGKQTTQGAFGLMKDKVQGARDVAEENILTKEKMGVFIGMSVGGFVCISLAFSFLPLIVLAPAKFALLFTLGSMLQFGGIISLRGPKTFFKNMFSAERRLFSAVYLGSVLGTLYGSLVARGYLITLAFSVVQLVALAYFLMSYFPGGTRALSFAFSGCMRVTRGVTGI